MINLVYILLIHLGSLLPDEYAAVGSGAEMALGILDAQYNSQMNEDDAKNLAIKSIKSCYSKRCSKWRWDRYSYYK